MRRFTIMFVVLAWLSVPLHVHARELRGDGNELLDYCTAEPGTFGYGWCIGYLHGTGTNLKVVCIPKGVIVEQLQRIVVKYLQDHPAILHEPTAYLVLLALVEAFPCAAQPSPQ